MLDSGYRLSLSVSHSINQSVHVPVCRLYADRQRLSAMVVENLLPSNGGLGEGDSASGPQSLNTITLQLEENLKEEQRFNCRMLYTVFKLGLNPVQVSTSV